jgi:hypothetical protein
VSRRREPVAEIGAEDYRIVRYTHDVELATKLMVAKLRAELEEAWAPDPAPPKDINPGRPKQTYVRIQGALPNSLAAAGGWSYAYHEYDKPGRGAFPAVVFR